MDVFSSISEGEKTIWGCLIILFAIFVVFPILFFSNEGRKKKRKVKELQARGGTLLADNALHVYGLPVPESVPCTVMTFPDHIEVQSGTMNVRLNREKITDMRVTTGTEIQKHYVSSVGGAVAGAALFGPIGAMVGGRAKEKTTDTTTYYLIITYLDKNKEFAFIGFNVNECKDEAYNIAAEFKKLNPDAATQIEL